MISESECDKELVGQKYDGAFVMKDNVTALQTQVFSSYPSALFTSVCSFYTLSCASDLSNNKTVHIFYSKLIDLSTFFLDLPEELINLCRKNCQQFIRPGGI